MPRDGAGGCKYGWEIWGKDMSRKSRLNNEMLVRIDYRSCPTEKAEGGF